MLNVVFKTILEVNLFNISKIVSQISNVLSKINNLKAKLTSDNYTSYENPQNIDLMKKYLNNKKWQLENSNNNIMQFYSFTFLFSLFDLPDVENASTLTRYSFGIFVLSLIVLSCYINIVGALITNSLIKTKNYEEKYARFKRIINYFNKTNLAYAIVEGIICLLALLTIIIFSYLHMRL